MSTNFKVEVNASQFLEEVKVANRILDKKNNLSVSELIVLEFANNTLTLKATDGNKYFNSKIPVNTNITDSFALHRDLLVNALQAINKDTLSLIKNTDEGKVYIQPYNENGQVTFSAALFLYGIDDLPKFPEVNVNNYISGLTSHFKDIFEKTFCIDKAGQRPALQGVNMKKSGTDFSLASTDSYRLSLLNETGFDTNMGDFSIILSPSLIAEVKRLTEDKVTFKVPDSNDYIILESDNRTITFPLISANYPDVTKLFRHRYEQTIKGKASHLKQAIESISFIASKNQNSAFKISIENGKAEAIAKSEVGTTKSLFENVEISNTDKPFSISLNNGFIKEILSKFDNNDTVVIELEGKFATFYQEGKDNEFKHLVIGILETSN